MDSVSRRMQMGLGHFFMEEEKRGMDFVERNGTIFGGFMLYPIFYFGGERG